MSKNPLYWFRGGAMDRELGNKAPVMTLEDFTANLEPALAQECYDAYIEGFFYPQTSIRKTAGESPVEQTESPAITPSK